jgi:fucose permease
VISSAFRLLFAAILSSQPPFPVFLISFAGLGYGTGLTDTAWNAWASGTSRPNVVSGFLHGSFSLGCVVGPAIVTVALGTGGTWRTFYVVLVRNPDIENALRSLLNIRTGVSAVRGAYSPVMGI